MAQADPNADGGANAAAIVLVVVVLLMLVVIVLWMSGAFTASPAEETVRRLIV